MTARLHVALALALSGCAGNTASTPSAAPRAPPSAESAASKPSAATPAPAAKTMVDEVVASALAKVSAARELGVLGVVKGRAIPLSEMVAHVDRDLDDEVPADVVRGTTELLYALGTVPASFDYRTSLLEVMRSELLGFYDPHEKTMFLRADLQGAEREATLWHELVHALQDQHYGLEKLIAYKPDAGDEQSAVHSLAEGDATSAMLDVMLIEKNMRATDVAQPLLDMQSAVSAGSLPQVPSILKRSVVAPYLDGLTFVNALRRRGGWAAVDAAWRRLPTSTEQLLHLDKYDAAEAPIAIAIPAASDGGNTAPIFSDVFGEQGLRILFDEWMPARTASEAASDWAGDHVAVFSRDGRTEVAWHLRFDSRAAASRALVAFARGALAEPTPTPGERLPDFVTQATAERVTRSGHLCQERPTRGPFAILQRGADLAVVLGAFWRNSAALLPERRCTAALAWAERIIGKNPQ